MGENAMTPSEFEVFVEQWVLKNLEVPKRQKPKITRLKQFNGKGGSYKIDISVEFTILKGARLVIFVECKHLRRPVERDAMQVLLTKLHDARAHKGIVFSTSGFQAGAIEFAKTYGIGAVEVRGDRLDNGGGGRKAFPAHLHYVVESRVSRRRLIAIKINTFF
jgi:restriction system protein